MGARRCDGNRAHSYGPWQFPEEPIPLYGDGQKVRHWLYLEDQVILTRTDGIGFRHDPSRSSRLASNSLTVVA